VLMPGEQINLSLLLDGESASQSSLLLPLICVAAVSVIDKFEYVFGHFVNFKMLSINLEKLTQVTLFVFTYAEEVIAKKTSQSTFTKFGGKWRRGTEETI